MFLHFNYVLYIEQTPWVLKCEHKMKVFSLAFLNFFKLCLFANFMFCNMAVMCR